MHVDGGRKYVLENVGAEVWAQVQKRGMLDLTRVFVLFVGCTG